MTHSRRLTLCLILGSFAAVFLICFGKAMNSQSQFGFRDAGHYYYPLYLRVQEEWRQGRWPLWEPEENSGMPLLGNPTAAVLYPGKLIYAVLPYPWAARGYIIVHSALAFLAMLITVRCWRVSWVGAGLAALTYAFGAPILFQYCNVIYLVGAAWLPLGFLAVERWLRQGSHWALLGLAFVLAMQTLGGDPQSAYLLGLCGGGYAVGLSWSRTRERPAGQPENEPARSGLTRFWRPAILAVVGLVAWVAATITLAEALPRVRPPGVPAPALPWMRYVPGIVLLAWSLAGLWLIMGRKARGNRPTLGVMLVGLAGSAVLAAALSAAQLLPVLEFMQQTTRAEGEGPHDIYPFSIEPFRLAELVWPSVLGTSFGQNAYWFEAVQVPGVRQKVWVPSLYLGGLSLMLAATAFTLRRGPASRVWLSVIVIVSVIGSLGQYTSPIWAARLLAQTTSIKVPEIGPLDTQLTNPIRLDRYLRDGDGGIYWWMTTALPGFRQFRFPAKLFTFVAFGIAALAGMGWDSLQEQSGRTRGILALASLLLVASLALLVMVLGQRPSLVAAIEGRGMGGSFGPLDARAGISELIRGLAHGSVMLALTVALIVLARRRVALAGMLALIFVSADLAVANARYVTTVPQALFDDEPEVVRIIREAERENPSPGPFRVHRMPQWGPTGWHSSSSPDRVRDFVAWERGTIQPKYGITEGIEYTHTLGVSELYDYEWFFGGFPYTVRGETARSLGIPSGQKVVYYPRRSFDMWNTRYFILPQYPNGWMDEDRGYAAFRFETEQVFPPLERFQGPNRIEELRAWIETKDYQVYRNRQVYPRAWVVHDSRALSPQEGKTRLERGGPMMEIVYDNDPIWHDPAMTSYDSHRLVWIDPQERLALREFLSGRSPRPGETATVTYPAPDRVEIEANLESPGVVVLADIYYPGWKLLIDDQPAPIHRVNLVMRGAAVPEGRHRLVYTYDPRSFRIGCAPRSPVSRPSRFSPSFSSSGLVRAPCSPRQTQPSRLAGYCDPAELKAAKQTCTASLANGPRIVGFVSSTSQTLRARSQSTCGSTWGIGFVRRLHNR